MRRRFTLARTVLLCALPWFSANGQSVSADSTGFRAGQWGAEFTIGTGNGIASGVGALRFFSDRRALLFDVDGRFLRETGESTIERTESGISLRVGPRWYRPVKGRVLQYVSVGALVAHDRRESPVYVSSTSPTSSSTAKSFGAGVFGEVGGSWMVTPQLSLGASWQGAVQHARSTRDAVTLNSSAIVPSTRSNVWSASFGTLALRAGVFF